MDATSGEQGERPSRPPCERRLALLVEYDGTDYNGFQLQQNAPSVQGALEEALYKLTRQRLRIHGASRTDSGAHASGQVAAVTLTTSLRVDAVRNALNFYLPEDVKVRRVVDVARAFDPRRDAVQRWYRYVISMSMVPPVLQRRQVHWMPYRLDVDAMNVAAKALLGSHDFKALAGNVPGGHSTVRRVDRWDVHREGDLVVMDVEGNAFLPQQIRKTAGALILVGRGVMSMKGLERLVAGGRVEAQPNVLPARGLCLMDVRYQTSPWGDTESQSGSCIMTVETNNEDG